MGIGKVGSRRAVFFDRDGVLIESVVRNGKPYPVSAASEARIVEGVAQMCRRLADAGFLLVCVTNQPDVARGTTTRQAVEAINRVVAEQTGISDFRVCYHDNIDMCDCRKPKPGLLRQAAAEHDIDLGASFMIGDRWKDTEAGRQAGCTTIFVDYHYDEREQSAPDFRVARVADALQYILKTE